MRTALQTPVAKLTCAGCGRQADFDLLLGRVASVWQIRFTPETFSGVEHREDGEHRIGVLPAYLTVQCLDCHWTTRSKTYAQPLTERTPEA